MAEFVKHQFAALTYGRMLSSRACYMASVQSCLLAAQYGC